MWRPDLLRPLLACLVAATAILLTAPSAAAAAAPCPGPVPVIDCTPSQPLPPIGIPRPGPSPSPTVQPSPGPVPGPEGQLGLPTDVGFNALALKVYSGAAWFTPQLYPMLNSTIGDSNWFQELYARMENIGALLLLLFLVLGLITAVIQRDLTLLFKVPFLYLPVAIGLTIAAIQLTQTLMAVVDGFTQYMLQSVGDDLAGTLSHLAAVLSAAAAGAALTGQGMAVFIIVVTAVVVGALGIMLELLARTAAIYVCLAFLPVTVTCLLWPKLVHLPKLLCEVLIGLILLKWVVAVVLVLGAKAFSANPFSTGPQGDPGFVSVVMGAAILLIGMASPLALIKVIPWVEGQVVGNWSGRARAMVSGAVTKVSLLRAADRLQKADGRVRLPLKSSQGGQGPPRIMVLPRGSQIFVRSPRPARGSRAPSAGYPSPPKGKGRS